MVALPHDSAYLDMALLTVPNCKFSCIGCHLPHPRVAEPSHQPHLATQILDDLTILLCATLPALQQPYVAGSVALHLTSFLCVPVVSAYSETTESHISNCCGHTSMCQFIWQHEPISTVCFLPESVDVLQAGIPASQSTIET